MWGIVFIICVLFVEYGISYYYHAEDVEAKFDQVVGWRMKPGIYEQKPTRSYVRIDYYINKLGLRNREIDTVKDRETKRIIILGDSFTFGHAVKNEGLFTTQLEKFLNETGSTKYEIINAGIPKYGTAQEWLLMKDLSKKNITGDIYILMMFTNDILDNLQLGNYYDLSKDSRQPGFVLGNDGNLVLKYPPMEEQTHLEEKSHVNKSLTEAKTENKFKDALNFPALNFTTIKFLKERIGTLLQTKPDAIKFLIRLGLDINLPRLPSLISGWYREDIADSGIPLMKALLKEIAKEARNNNAELFVVFIPSSIQINADTYRPILQNSHPHNEAVAHWLQDPVKPQRIVQQMCEDLNIHFFDLLPVMIENKDKNLFITGDGHFSQAGHDLVAKSLADLLKSH